MMLFDTLPIWSQLPPTFNTIDHIKSDNNFFAHIEYEQYHFDLVGIDQPVPDDVISSPINCSHWSQEEKAPLRSHHSHILFTYQGESTDMTELMIAAFKVMGEFIDHGLLGIVDPHAWNCLPVKVLADLVKPDMLESQRQAIPLGLWTGFVKMFETEQELWFCTKGYDRFGVCDFAYHGTHDQADEIFKLFTVLFWYVHDSLTIPDIGDTASIGTEQVIRFHEVTEYPDFLESPLGTRVIKEIEQTAIH